MAANSSLRLSEDIDKALGRWFPPGQPVPCAQRKRFSEEDIRGIADVLRRYGKPSWSRIPRTFATLRVIDQVAEMPFFEDDNTTDLAFPYTQQTLPISFKAPLARCEFLEAQVLVLSKGYELEKKCGRHCHFVDPKDVPLEKLEELGKGLHSYVDRVRSTISYEEYARKLIRRKTAFRKDRAILRDFEKELGSLKRLSHRHIVSLIGSYTDPRYVAIIMSPVADCNLKGFLDRKDLSAGNLSILRTFYGCLANAVCYLHENRVRHRDIKPENILVKSHHVYLSDFGISLDWSENGRDTTEGPGSKTLRYCAPEVAANEPRNSSSDIWSLGCVFLEIWTTICNKSTADLANFMDNNGVHSRAYYSNRGVLDTWWESLTVERNVEHDKPLEWIKLMLQVDPNSRCSAQALWHEIREANEREEIPFSLTGRCCTEEDESSESVLSSDDGLDEIDKTVDAIARRADSLLRPSLETPKDPIIQPILENSISSNDESQRSPRCSQVFSEEQIFNAELDPEAADTEQDISFSNSTISSEPPHLPNFSWISNQDHLLLALSSSLGDQSVHTTRSIEQEKKHRLSDNSYDDSPTLDDNQEENVAHKAPHSDKDSLSEAGSMKEDALYDPHPEGPELSKDGYSADREQRENQFIKSPSQSKSPLSGSRSMNAELETLFKSGTQPRKASRLHIFVDIAHFHKSCLDIRPSTTIINPRYCNTANWQRLLLETVRTFDDLGFAWFPMKHGIEGSYPAFQFLKQAADARSHSSSLALAMNSERKETFEVWRKDLVSGPWEGLWNRQRIVIRVTFQKQPFNGNCGIRFSFSSLTYPLAKSESNFLIETIAKDVAMKSCSALDVAGHGKPVGRARPMPMRRAILDH